MGGELRACLLHSSFKVQGEQPHLESLPQDYEETNQLHYFHYLLLLKGLAQEKLLVAIQEHTRRPWQSAYSLLS